MKGHAMRGWNIMRRGTRRKCRKCHNVNQLRSYYRHRTARMKAMSAYNEKHRPTAPKSHRNK